MSVRIKTDCHKIHPKSLRSGRNILHFDEKRNCWIGLGKERIYEESDAHLYFNKLLKMLDNKRS